MRKDELAMAKTYKVKIDNKYYTYTGAVTFGDVAADHRENMKYPIVMAIADERLCELNKKLWGDHDIRFITLADPIGNLAYKRSASMMLYKAFNDVKKDNGSSVHLRFSVPGGYYYTIEGPEKPDESLLQRIRIRMKEIADEGLVFEKKTFSTSKARKMFTKAGMADKEKLFRFRVSSFVNIYQLGDYKDYLYGYMLQDTSLIRYFDLHLYQEGFVMMLPEKKDPYLVPEFVPSPKLFDVRNEFEIIGDKMDIRTIGDLNEKICSGEIDQIRLVEEAIQSAKIAEIGSRIADDGKIKIVCIAGPSSSGKTTFSRKIAIQLKAKGLRPHTVSLDNYYKERFETPRDENGNYDFECIESLDLDLFRDQMEKLLRGEKIELPSYNFTWGGKEYLGDYLQMGPKDILIIEGIHGLNERLSYFIPKEQKFKIYISALTLLNIDEHNYVPTTDGRLIRRIVRDYKFRATSAKRTISMWNSVRRGEELYIFPFQEEADVIVNSAQTYEMAVLKLYAEPLLFQVPEDCPEYLEAKRLLKFLDYFIAYPADDIPNDSILREFIGGSCFDV